MERAKQLSVLLPNKGGELAKLCGVLAGAQINIQGLSIVESTEHGIVRLVVDKPNAAASVLEQNSMLVTESDVLVIALPDKVGALREVAAKLTAAKVNINYVYGSAAQIGEPARIMLSVDRLSEAEAALAGT